MRSSNMTLSLVAIVGGMFLSGGLEPAFGQSRTVITAGKSARPTVANEVHGVSTDVVANSYGIESASTGATQLISSVGPDIFIADLQSVHRVTIIGGPGGDTVVSRAVSSVGTTCEGDPGAGYCNTLGSYMFGPSGDLAGARFSDDIALARVGGCILDRYVIRVTGDKDRDGSGTALGTYTVNFGLYEACPGAGADDPIGGTADQVTVPAEQSGDIYEIEFHPSFGAQVELPPNLYLGVRFSREKCGVVVGAPATLGHSVDRFDFPGFACAAGLGGFPDGPHASFYAEIYVEGDCPDAFVGYKNTNHAGSYYSAGVRERFADDVTLDVIDCNMVAYEIAHKGDGIVGVDLRSFLNNTEPDLGGVIPGTPMYCFSSGSDVQICRKEFYKCDGGERDGMTCDPDEPVSQECPGGSCVIAPIALPRSTFFVAYRTSSRYTGPVLTCKEANPGSTEDFFRVYTGEEWAVQEFGGQCWAGFELTIFCEGTPPVGACCDMILKDEDGEAVCRDNLPEMNCANPDPLLWKEDRECTSTCIGGDNAGELCTRQADCPEGTCPGPFNHPCGVSACCKPEGGCENLTENACYAIEPVDAPRMYQRGDFCGEGGQRCPIPACMAREGECTVPREAFCWAGDRHGEPCEPYVYPSDCPGYTCIGGSHDGEVCDQDAECPGGGECVEFVCHGGTNNGQSCNPNSDCPAGACTLGHCVGGVGCENPFCCTAVCQQPGFSYCCYEYWDWQCAAETFRVCTQPPSNDDCYSPDPRNGARLVNIPCMVESDGIRATTGATEPGFCCSTGHESDPSLGPGSRGFGTVWYKFVAPPNGVCDGGERNGYFCDPNAADPENPFDGCPEGTCLSLPISVQLDTCCSISRPGGPADDSIISVYALAEPDRGLCSDGLTLCSVSQQDCPDGSPCMFDEEYACLTPIPIACSDDEETCSCLGYPEPTRSKVCVRGLVPGETYYVMVGAKTDANRGVYRLRLVSPCGGTPLMDNDLSMNAELLTGEQVVVPFDISGEAFNRAPATFDCPGPPVTCFDVLKTIQNDVWYEWTAPYNGEATFQTCGFDENGNPVDELTPDTAMVVYEGCDCPVQIGTELGCSYFEPSPCFLGSKVTIDVIEGRCYKVRLGGRLGMTHDPMTGDPIAGELRIDVNVPDCAPSIIQQPADQTVCVDHMATFTVVADGWEPLTYQWRKDAIDLEDGGNVTGATTAVLTIDPAGLNDVGEYDVVVSNVCGTVTSNAATLTLTCVPGGPKFSVVAVRINGTCVGGSSAGEHCTRDIDCDSGVCGGSIAPTDAVLVRPGDKIQCEVFASEWTPENQDEPVLSGYQVTFLIEKFQAEPPTQGELIPFRGLRPCQHNDECHGLPRGCVSGFCDTSYDKAGGAFIRVFREDYVFLGWPQILGVDFSYNYRFAASLSSPNIELVYEPPPKYCGTLILTVSDDACGVFTVVMEDFDLQRESSFMQDFWRFPILPLETQPLTIRVWQRPKLAPRLPPTER